MSCGPFIVEFVEGDLLPFLDVEFEGEDITGWTILLHVRRPNKTKVSKTAVIDDANVGEAGSAKFHFEWTAGDLVEGDSQAEIELFDLAGRNQTFTGLILKVSEQIS